MGIFGAHFFWHNKLTGELYRAMKDSIWPGWKFIPDAQEPDESSTSEFPKGIKWYGDWVDAKFRLPRGYQMPCEVKFANGKSGIWITTGQDWREVMQWRPVQMTKGAIQRLRMERKILVYEEDEA